MDFNPDVLLDTLRADLESCPTDEIGNFKKEQLLKSVIKKYANPGHDVLLHREAIDSFVSRNEAMATSFTVPNHRATLFEAWKDGLFRFFCSEPYQTSFVTLDACLDRGQAGPGASRGTRHANFLDKMFNSTLTMTDSGLYRHYVGRLSPRWAQAELFRFQAHSNKIVRGSALTTVHKDAKRNRTICTEPSLNMFYQLGAKSLINDRMVSVYRLDVTKQPSINKLLACRGSIDGSNATLDLENASDSIHVDLCRQVLPRSVFWVLDFIRSKTFETDGVVRDLNMISSMGNGFTFSLMTVLITSLLDAFLQAKRDRYTPFRDGVFGDDIICPAKYAVEFSDVLSDFGFKVNTSKSFVTGHFRESCGGDYYKGHDVRGVYIKRCNNDAEVYSTFNRLHWWSIRHGVPIPRVLLYLKGLADFRPVPLDAAEHEGFRIPLECTTSRKFDRNGAVFYRPLVPIGRSRKVGDNEYNPFGALIAHLGGYIRNHAVSLRSVGASTRYKVARKVTSSWDYLPTPYFTSRELSLSWRMLLSIR